MNKREFIKILGLSGLGLLGGNALNAFTKSPLLSKMGKKKMKNWAWIMTDIKTSDDEWKKLFAQMRQSGIDAVLPEIYDSSFAYYKSRHLPVKDAWLERLLPIAKSEGLELHAWMRSMMCNIKEVSQKHPHWFVVNRKGESAAVKPAYVPYYKFMCPTHPEVQEFVRETVSELSQIKDLDGVHLDYIRFPDVILAEKLQPKYHIVQDREYPEYDYCYCEVCQSEFKKQTGIDVMKLKDPAASQEWRQFRYDRITNLVNNKLLPEAHKHNKQVTAAVFPNWESVRQQWSKWNLDGFLPMLYHGYYGKGIGWIGDETSKEIKALSKPAPVYSGLFIPQLNPSELAEAVETSVAGGAAGVSLFLANSMTDEHWKSFRQAVEKD